MLIWDTNPRSPESFSPIGLGTAEKLQFPSVPDYNRLQQQTTTTDRQTDRNHRKAGKTIVRCNLPVATDNKVEKIKSLWVVNEIRKSNSIKNFILKVLFKYCE
jgi:hypothetical protein